MHAIRAVIQDGNITLEEPLDFKGRAEAIVVVLDPDPWQAIIEDPRPRPALAKAGQEALEAFLAGQATPLDPETMT